MLFQPDDLIAEAERETGLSDWGGNEFRAPLARLAAAAAEEAFLTPAGQRHLTDRLRTILRNRLRLFADRQRIPGIAAQEIIRPIFITGLPRAGTTHTHELLALDPATRSPRLWEILDPSPPAKCDELDRGPRLRRVQEALETWGFSSPELRRIHQTDAASAEEDGFIFEYSLVSRNFPAFWRMPSYFDYISTLDHLPVYQMHKMFLQSCQSGCAGDRWVLKAPMHIYFMEALFAVYPDAIVIQNHRDPARIIPSMGNFYTKLRGIFSDHVDPAEIGEFNLHSWIEGLDRMAAFRSRPEYQSRFFDIHYLDIARKPLETIERFYSQFGLHLGDAARTRMQDYVERREREGHGTDYSLETFGLEARQIDDVYGDYMARYGVEKEQRK